MKYDHNNNVGLFKFQSGYRKIYLNSPKGYCRKIINAQTGLTLYVLGSVGETRNVCYRVVKQLHKVKKKEKAGNNYVNKGQCDHGVWGNWWVIHGMRIVCYMYMNLYNTIIILHVMIHSK